MLPPCFGASEREKPAGSARFQPEGRSLNAAVRDGVKVVEIGRPRCSLHARRFHSSTRTSATSRPRLCSTLHDTAQRTPPARRRRSVPSRTLNWCHTSCILSTKKLRNTKVLCHGDADLCGDLIHGTRICADWDGTRICADWDGTRTCADWDGTRICADWDGTRICADWDGTRICADWDGTRICADWEGTRICADFAAGTRGSP
jgi:hypothetical protein